MIANDFGNMIHKIENMTSISTTPSDSIILNALLVVMVVVIMLACIYKLRGGNLVHGVGISVLAVASFMSVLAIPLGIYLVLKIFGGSVQQ